MFLRGVKSSLHGRKEWWRRHLTALVRAEEGQGLVRAGEGQGVVEMKGEG